MYLKYIRFFKKKQEKKKKEKKETRIKKIHTQSKVKVFGTTNLNYLLCII